MKLMEWNVEMRIHAADVGDVTLNFNRNGFCFVQFSQCNLFRMDDGEWMDPDEFDGHIIEIEFAHERSEYQTALAFGIEIEIELMPIPCVLVLLDKCGHLMAKSIENTTKTENAFVWTNGQWTYNIYCMHCWRHIPPQCWIECTLSADNIIGRHQTIPLHSTPYSLYLDSIK